MNVVYLFICAFTYLFMKLFAHLLKSYQQNSNAIL
jgi:hypothetical protein